MCNDSAVCVEYVGFLAALEGDGIMLSFGSRRYQSFISVISAFAIGFVYLVVHPTAPTAVAEELPAADAKPAEGADHPLLESARGKASYGIGMSIGRQLSQEGIAVEDLESLLLGIQDALETRDPRITEAQFQAAMLVMRQQRELKVGELAKTNLQEGKDFLEKNATRKEVKTLASGLQYEVLKAAAKGAKSPKATDVVSTHYKGTLLSGTEFDSSYKRNEPAEFGVGDVIAGWTEALQLMKVGERWKIYIPAELAYKEAGSPPVIGPNATLIFELELLGIK